MTPKLTVATSRLITLLDHETVDIDAFDDDVKQALVIAIEDTRAALMEVNTMPGLDTQNQIAPCPFCGHQAELISAAPKDGVYIECRHCFVYGPAMLSAAAASEHWNRRFRASPRAHAERPAEAVQP
jgi:Lar family restriction alleviation protein